MAERDPIDLIKEQLNGVDALSGLHGEHETFLRWQGETKTILEKAFSSKSIHYQSFVALRFREVIAKAFASPEIDKINTARYKRDLEHAKNILQGAIKELTLDRTLFKRIQTTPKTVEFALKGEYFISSDIVDPEIVKSVRDAFEGSGLTPIPGSEGSRKEVPFHQRIEQIKRARFGIYDVSSLDPSDVLLEIGAALALGKEAILICRKGSSLSALLRELGPLEYENGADLTEKLRKKVKV